MLLVVFQRATGLEIARSAEQDSWLRTGSVGVLIVLESLPQDHSHGHKFQLGFLCGHLSGPKIGGNADETNCK